MNQILETVVSVLPVLLFLAALIFLDSYKLVTFRSVVITTGVGCLTAVFCLTMNTVILEQSGIEFTTYSRYGAPIIEEFCKCIYMIFLLRTKRIGFLVDAAIYGFALGAGFACIENIYYLKTIPHPNEFLWVIRGFGTAVMHGGATAVFGILSKNLSEVTSWNRWLVFVPGLGTAIVLHSFFNHFFFSPFVSTIGQLVLLPIVITTVYNRSRTSLYRWLKMEMDAELLVLKMISKGLIHETRIGIDLKTLENRLPQDTISDMFSMFRIHLELSIRLKGILMLRAFEFQIPSDPEIEEKLTKLQRLKKRIGKTAYLAIQPYLYTSSRDVWELRMLNRT